jgi:hypothetical protein
MMLFLNLPVNTVVQSAITLLNLRGSNLRRRLQLLLVRSMPAWRSRSGRSSLGPCGPGGSC